ncbi:bifunctional phosphoribosylaminoimidazolecarboxamide formyltransferase/IMP cyclohydrolase [Naumannella halotolerans]|uniref:Bifunctional purine biosynthesis protein PurH n=1 Tax=Naumannella halotolerans TaxID=993414 RepID=A0A4V3ENY9_9ACTN|nr:bifunctional phosphoribosylaminoimidazolecarboxamide formyltransferase/IMP cyclohydrolase [Naumannella halotolerans]TDT34188.1 phosphoribosylaminoimidazolecarboxamide formyltransferase/IMP cyclohydrolase [Naumannella halotolerans]
MSNAPSDPVEGTGADGRRPIRRALVSVYDKAHLSELAAALKAASVEVVSTGSTARQLAAAGLQVTEVEQVTGSPEMLDGRVKTLHPAIHGGILADQRRPEHLAQLEELGIAPFDLVVSNLYPFAETVASGAAPAQVIEQIDIGGPAMVRASAKNHASIAIITSPDQYPQLFAALDNGGFTLAERTLLAARAYQHTATYDVAVAGWMGSVLTDTSEGTGFPEWRGATWRRAEVLRYGENSHQAAALYRGQEPGLAGAEQLHGKPMSYNNWVDADSARRAALDFTEPAVAIIKHSNPCGIAVAADIAAAHRAAHATDPVSAYGGVIATNREVDAEMAAQVAEVFTEVIVAPDYSPEALERLQAKKNLRILRCPITEPSPTEQRSISGGLLVQQVDRYQAEGDDPANWQLVSGRAADEATLADLAFAWRAVRAVKSNAILLAKDTAAVGVGMGQVNRVDSCRLAVRRAGDRVYGSVAASDAFFPFADGPQILIDAGVRAIVQPGGSIRDAETIEAAQAAGVTMYLTQTRHFFH